MVGAKRRVLIWCTVMVVSAMAAAAAQAKPRHKVKLPYTSGTYLGSLAQLVPSPAVSVIRFGVSGRTLSGVSVKVIEVCGYVLPSVLGDSPKGLSVPISPDGSFAYDQIVQGDHIQFKGRLHGHQATGTFFDTLQIGVLQCTMVRPASFTARH